MIKTCQYCGAVNGEPTDICCFCDAPLGGSGGAPASRRIITPTEGNLAVEPEWRREVSSKLQDFRARRRGGAIADLQTTLPFDIDSPSSPESSTVQRDVRPPISAKKPRESRKHRQERFEISIPQLETALASADTHWPAASQSGAEIALSPLCPVALLRDRRKSALVDAGLLLFSYGGMLALFTVLGGHIGLNRLDLSVAGATFVLFYAQYFALFTIFGGSTPGMMICGLRAVSFDGGTPTSRQMAWRSFGYLVSAGSCFLGFVWALWDEDRLCWQDRISHTYLTPNDEIRSY